MLLFSSCVGSQLSDPVMLDDSGCESDGGAPRVKWSSRKHVTLPPRTPSSDEPNDNEEAIKSNVGTAGSPQLAEMPVAKSTPLIQSPTTIAPGPTTAQTLPLSQAFHRPPRNVHWDLENRGVTNIPYEVLLRRSRETPQMASEYVRWCFMNMLPMEKVREVGGKTERLERIIDGLFLYYNLKTRIVIGSTVLCAHANTGFHVCVVAPSHDDLTFAIQALHRHVLFDRECCWVVHTQVEDMKLRDHCTNMRSLPQEERHRRTEGLPCQPFVFEVARALPHSATW